jgi:uncharacterized repeat protein (TIGR03806 family)
MKLVLLFILEAVLLFSFGRTKPVFTRMDKLSDYQFFKAKLSDLNPAQGVIPYSVNTPLFSNYAEKSRFVRFPEGAKATYADSTPFSFPTGTILIKNFYYPLDFRSPLKGRKILETRLLVHEETGWHAYPYIWNEEQTEAFYDPAGETKEIAYVNSSGKKVKSHYVIPNKNQCKGCHGKGDELMPIGPSARQLNKNIIHDTETVNQLTFWYKLGVLDRLPEALPKMAVWDDPQSGSLNERARAYLDANCGHCHSPQGPANTSGLYLDIFQSEEGRLGVNKTPVAAGRGAGDFEFDIKPGDPQHSILVYRMNTIDPAIAMPEIGREQIHQEGVALIEDWIRKNAFRN